MISGRLRPHPNYVVMNNINIAIETGEEVDVGYDRLNTRLVERACRVCNPSPLTQTPAQHHQSG